MGLDSFNTTSSSTASKPSGSSSSKPSDQTTLNGGQVSYCVDQWGRPSYQLLRDPEWISDRLEEDWGVEDFLDELATFPRTLIEAFKHAVQAGEIELDDIPDYDGRSFKSNHLKWYVEMSIKHIELTDIPCDNTPNVTGKRKDLPSEFTDNVEPSVSTESVVDGNEEDESKQVSGLEAFKS